ncbi:hypothetical protein, conserved [Eimeria tenella]|uniref:Uncharacterized protein n=1 Tax=Eimeria tenella TaxID=5802 RepID=U6KX76_EIMTE|nr:hypothetical protein, conserved [Eimeria tenella]CDJ42762.1 hypothetical protein, conserved [Eimeria tenella]|eukprot:XP_013233512.1 hypothetical protein, conserved [Eimeria tenella]
MISLHQLFRVLSRISSDPSTPFYAAALQSPVVGTPGGVQRELSGTPSPLKGLKPAFDARLLTTCTTTAPAHGALSPGACGLDDCLCDEADCSAFSLGNSSNSGSRTLDADDGSAAASVRATSSGDSKTTHQKLAVSAAHDLPSQIYSSNSNSPRTAAASPLVAPLSLSSTPSSASNAVWGSPLRMSPVETPDGLLRSFMGSEGTAGPFAARGSPQLCQQQEPQNPLIGSTAGAAADAAAATAALREMQEETDSELCLGSSYRAARRQRRRPWPQQTPWDSSGSRGAAAAAACIVPAVQQHKSEGRMQTRRGAAAAAGHHSPPRPEDETDILQGMIEGPRHSRRRPPSSRTHQQRIPTAAAAAAAAAPAATVSTAAGAVPLPLEPMACGEGSIARGAPAVGSSRLLGVCFSPPKDVWRARITVEGKQFEQQFSVKRHGYDGARMLAARWRAEMEHARLLRPLALP